MDNLKELKSALDSSAGGVSDDEDRLILALDFGTTFSGVSYAFTNDPEKIYTIDSWPGATDRIVPKTPTEIQYTAGKFKWGYELEGTLEDKIIGLKLLLDPDQKRPYWIPTDPGAEIAKLPKPVVEVAADYIKAVFQHALAEVEKGYLPGFLDGFKKQHVLTVPAVWSDTAKAMTERAARMAGVSPIDMITEPEAAALFTLRTMKDKGLKDGDVIVICDAGGGTVDLVSYEIVSLTPFEVKGSTVPSGGALGSLMLNRSFEELIRQTVGEEAFVSLKKTEGYRSALREFDAAHKLSFRGPRDSDRYVNFPMANLKDNKAKGLVKNCMTLTGQTMFRIFDPIIQEIVKLVVEQVRDVQIKRLESKHKNGSDVKAVFLVGGFGASAYLKECIQAANPDIMVVQPKEAWSAIARGAALSKLPLGPSIPQVISTRATKHYGVLYHMAWDPIRDKGQPKVQFKHWPGDRCQLMRWYINKEDELNRGEKYRYEFSRNFSLNPEPEELEVTDNLEECTSVRAPVHPNDTIDIKKNCTLTVDLAKVPKSFFKVREADGKQHSRIRYSLILENLPSGLMKFALEVGGKEYAAVEAKY
ncbi:Hsp70 family protein-like protein [Xylaria arbuscula]|nr:Hsp70 family protein-like protein [Xylaria arbuscula]